MSSRRVEYRFKIDAFTRETIPMWRLSEYLLSLSVLLGERDHVHFERLEDGSAVPVVAVEWESQPKVQRRVHEAKNHDGPEDARRAIETINRKLAEDNATAELIDPDGARILPFPGRKRLTQPEYGPFNQQGTLDGVVARIGGETAEVDPVPVHLQEGKVLHICRAPQDVARRLAPFLLEPNKPIRVSGVGRWFRDAHGQWEMRSFTITGLDPLRKTTLSEVVERLRKIPANWDINDVANMRHDPSESES
jgi:hypothetical protein